MANELFIYPVGISPPGGWLEDGFLDDSGWFLGQVGTPAISRPVAPSSIDSDGLVGQPNLRYNQLLTAAALPSSEAIPLPVIEAIPTEFILPDGIQGAAIVPTQHLIYDQFIGARGIFSEAFGTPSIGLEIELDFDLHLEAASRTEYAPFDIAELERMGGFEIKPLDAQTLPLPLPQAPPAEEMAVDKATRLQSDAALLEEHAVELLERIRLQAGSLNFSVPSEDTALRAALLALHLDTSTVSFQDYLDLLTLQIDLAQHAGQNGVNEGLMHASSQTEAVVSFYEGQLTNTISEPAAWAMQAKPLVKTKHTAIVIKDHLGGYQSFPVNNTILDAMGGSASLSDIIEDCIPCLDRALNLDGIQPFEQFLDLLQSEIDRRWNYIQGLWSAFNSRDLDICDLLNYLNGLCIPDLFAILATLAYYWIQLTKLLQMNVWGLLWSLIQPLLQSLLCNLNGLLEQFIRLIMAPIECIITSIDHEYAKLYNLGRATNRDFWTKGPNYTKPYDHTFAKWANENVTNPVLRGTGPYGMGLLELKRSLVNARDFINSQIKRLRDAIQESLGLDADALTSSYGLFLIMRWLSMVIGLVKAIIRFKQDGYSCAPDGSLSYSQYSTLVDYLSDATGIPFIITTTSATEVPLVPGLPSNTPTNQAGLITDMLGSLTAGDISATEPEADLAAGYSLPDCVARRGELENARNAVWAAELDALVP